MNRKNGTHHSFVIIGAGPYGLALAGRLRSAGVDYALCGRPMSFWKARVPKGMSLLSEPVGVTLSATRFTTNDHESARGVGYTKPFPAEEFVEYGLWFQRNACPEVDERMVVRVARQDGGYSVSLEDGAEITADKVVVATGLETFIFRAPEFQALPPGFAFHTADLHDLGSFRGKEIAVIGGGQSALECAALLTENGAKVEVLTRSSQLLWRPFGGHFGAGQVQSYFHKVLRDSLNDSDFYWQMPRFVRSWWLNRTMRPSADELLPPRLKLVAIKLECYVKSASIENGRVKLQLADGSSRSVDRVILGTGFQVNINSLPFLPPELRCEIKQDQGFPVVNRMLESSVPGLYFIGAPASLSLGPQMWFVKGAVWSAERIGGAVRQPLVRHDVPVTTQV